MSTAGIDYDPRIIVALDVNNLESAHRLLAELSPHVNIFKVGLEMIVNCGLHASVDMVHEYDKEVMVDEKFFDIPETVGRAVKGVARLGALMCTVHASIKLDGLRAAVENKGATKLLAVTHLTSLEADMLIVRQHTHDAVMSGCDGIVCSGHDLGSLDPYHTRNLIRVVPSVRSSGEATHDQKRVVTPAEAIRSGANFIVVGRQVTLKPRGKRADEVIKIVQEIEAMETERKKADV
jgi:orotidine-5'-phosphate decarboxylase